MRAAASVQQPLNNGGGAGWDGARRQYDKPARQQQPRQRPSAASDRQQPRGPADAIRGAARWNDLLAPAADLAAMSDPQLLGALLVRCLQLAPGRRAGAAEVEQFEAFVAHILELSVRVMRKAARGAEAAAAAAAAAAADEREQEEEGKAGEPAPAASEAAASVSEAAGSSGGFAPWQVSNFLYHLDRANITPGPRWERALWQSTIGQLAAGEWGAHELSRTAFSLSRRRMGQSAPYAWRAAFLAAWARRWSDATPRQLSSVLAGVAAMGWRVTPAWAAEARAATAAALGECGEQDLVWLVWGLAVVGDRVHEPSGSSTGSGSSSVTVSSGPVSVGARRTSRPDIPLTLAIEQALTRQLPAMPPRQLALSANALSRLGAAEGGRSRDDQILRDLLACARDKMDQFSFEDLSELLESLARLHAGHLLSASWTEAALGQLQTQLPACRGPALATALKAMGALGWRQHRGAAARLLWRSEPMLKRMGPQELAALAIGLVRLGHRPPPVWIFNYLTACDACMGAAGPQALSQIAWALARLSVRPAWGGTWTEKLCAAAAAPESLPRLGEKEMAMLLYALGSWRHVPGDAAVWARLQGRLRELLPRAGARTVATAVTALARMRLKGGGGGSSGDEQQHEGVDDDDEEGEATTSTTSSSNTSSSSAKGGGYDADDIWSVFPERNRRWVSPAISARTLAALLLRSQALLVTTSEWAATAGGGGGGARQRGEDAAVFGAADLAGTGKGLALLGARPSEAWLAAWRLAAERYDSSFDARARDSAAWATQVMQGRVEVVFGGEGRRRSAPRGGGGGGDESSDG